MKENLLHISKTPELFESHSVKDTQDWGQRIAATLSAGDILGLCGIFGAGKTYLVKSICAHFGIDPVDVTSPSFTLVNEYRGTLPLVHIDTYRLKQDEEFELLDLDYYLSRGAIVLIEWADKVWHLLPEGAKKVDIQITGEHTRTIEYSG